MAFRFRFETVLTVKERKEDERRRQLAAEESRLASKAAELRVWEEAHRQGVKTFFEVCNGVIDIEFLSRCQCHLEFLKNRRDTCRQEIEEIRREVEKARGRLVEARKERKVMEQLKEKNRQVYVQEEMAKEQRFLDDIGISVHGRKRR